MLEKEQVKSVLKSPRTNIYYAVNLVKKYILQKEVMTLVLGSMVEQIEQYNKKSKPTTQQLYNYFYNALSSTLKGTTFGKSDYAAKQFLKNVWNDGTVQQQIIGYFRKYGYKKPSLLEEEKKQRDARVKKKEVDKSASNARKAKKIKKCRSCSYENCLNRVAEFEKEFEKTQKTVPVCYKTKETLTQVKEQKLGPYKGEASEPVKPGPFKGETPKAIPASEETVDTYKGKKVTPEQQAYLDTLKNL